MPQENRKRGKKHKKAADHAYPPASTQLYTPASEAAPSWIVASTSEAPDHVDSDAPFGYLDADVKGYFRSVDQQIKSWLMPANDEENDEGDPNEAKRLFFIAALTEMSGKEKQLATDPDCSMILERMLHSMDDFARRVLLDRLAGSYSTLVKHRFGSHVCQTLFKVSASTISRELQSSNGSSESQDDGELRTLTQLILDICEELRPCLTSLALNAYGSHVLRALLALLLPSLCHPNNGNTITDHNRSKRSLKFKSRQAPLKSVFQDSVSQTLPTSTAPPSSPELRVAAENIVYTFKKSLNHNEIRALASDKVASPVLQILLEAEAELGQSESENSLMDSILEGGLTNLRADPEATFSHSAYILTLLRDPTASHLLETLFSTVPVAAFNALWKSYFQSDGQLRRLSLHPVANFVVARMLSRLDHEQIGIAIDILHESWGDIMVASRTGVLRALVDRAVVLHSPRQADLFPALIAAFGANAGVDGHKHLISCVMVMKPLEAYSTLIAEKESRKQVSGQHPSEQVNTNQRISEPEDPLEPKLHGALLLQSLLKTDSPFNRPLIESIKSLTVGEVLDFSRHPISSRVLDVFLDYSTSNIPFKDKRALVMSLIGHYHILVDNKIGSRIGDRCWAFADPYLREKIARSLIQHEQFLAGSFYGKFFTRNLNLYLLQRSPDQWRDKQAQSKAAMKSSTDSDQPAKSVTIAMSQSSFTSAETTRLSHKRRRVEKTNDEIEILFQTHRQGAKKSRLEQETTALERLEISTDNFQSKQLRASQIIPATDLGEIFGAIKNAPKERLKSQKRAK